MAKILIIGYNFTPEPIGIGKYSGELAGYLVVKGHHVQVITAYPYYPQWAVDPVYRQYRFSNERMNGVEVCRCPIFVPKKASGFKRILLDLSFFVSSFLAVTALILGRKKYAAIVVVSPSFLSGLVGLWYRLWNWNTPMIYHIQDLQIDAAAELGLIKNRFLLKLLFVLEKYILKKSKKVSTISLGMQKKLLAKGVDPTKLILFPNWVDVDLISPLPKSKSLRAEFGLKTTDKVVLYSGNLGEKQGLEVLISLAKHFSDRPEVQFVVCGLGGMKEKLIAEAKNADLQNMQFYPLQPEEKLAALLATADIHLVLQKNSAADLVMPSKLSGIWAARGCALVTAMPGTDLYHTIEKYNLGLLVEPESAPALIGALTEALTINLDSYRTNARSYALSYLAKEPVLNCFENELKSLF